MPSINLRARSCVNCDFPIFRVTALIASLISLSAERPRRVRSPRVVTRTSRLGTESAACSLLGSPAITPRIPSHVAFQSLVKLLHCACGSLPGLNHSLRDSPHQSEAMVPLATSICIGSNERGGCHAVSRLGVCHPSRTNSLQAGAAKWPPVAAPPSGCGASSPNQTAATIVGVYPTNHTSAPSLVVPVFPATGPRMPALRTPRPVPSSTTLRNIDVTRNASVLSMTRALAGVCPRHNTRPNASLTCTIRCGVTR